MKDKVASSLPLESGFSSSTKENKAQEELVLMSPNSVKVGAKACPEMPLQTSTLCNILTTEESSLKNKPSFADKNRPVMANGRVNAFALMMKHSTGLLTLQGDNNIPYIYWIPYGLPRREAHVVCPNNHTKWLTWRDCSWSTIQAHDTARQMLGLWSLEMEAILDGASKNTPTQTSK
uniref:Uncharacterized protein n=1 Tax=Timema shepardi TaxID=629360 RepID=A0A7R9B153_TIMSH|nr:unnamed protein product [Timema shepardi]